MTRINDFLRSEAAVLLLLALALLAQTPHTASVFHRLAPESSVSALAWVHAWVYAVALETATLVFVVRGQRPLAWGFALVSVAVNAAYYWRPGMGTEQLLAAALVSIALPSAIAFYSHDVARGVRTDARTQKRAPKQASASSAPSAPNARTSALAPKRARTAPGAHTQVRTPEERRAQVRALLERGAQVDVRALAQAWGVHVSTARRTVQRVQQERTEDVHPVQVHANGASKWSG